MNDFYLYYDEIDTRSNTAKILEISSRKREGNYIRIPAGLAVDLMTGVENLARWTLVLDPDTSKLGLKRDHGVHSTPKPFYSIPGSCRKPDIIIIFNGKSFEFSTTITYTITNPELFFFVTVLDQPFIKLAQFSCYLNDIMKGISIEVEDVPKEFSLYTIKQFEYKLIKKRS